MPEIVGRRRRGVVARQRERVEAIGGNRPFFFFLVCGEATRRVISQGERDD